MEKCAIFSQMDEPLIYEPKTLILDPDSFIFGANKHMKWEFNQIIQRCVYFFTASVAFRRVGAIHQHLSPDRPPTNIVSTPRNLNFDFDFQLQL